MRDSWTDERLDDFRGEVNRRFDAVDRRFEAVDRRFEHIENRLDEINRALLQMNQTMLRFGGGAIVTFVVGFIGVIATMWLT
jgi:tetrahydromethanopterin S-methyltransferase subunit G